MWKADNCGDRLCDLHILRTYLFFVRLSKFVFENSELCLFVFLHLSGVHQIQHCNPLIKNYNCQGMNPIMSF